jgi:hypothetical protein
MLTLRVEQIRAFEATQLKHFEARLAARLAEMFPKEAAALRQGGSETDRYRELLQKSMKRAADYGLEYECDHAIFALLMLANLRHGERDSRFLAWTAPLLTREATRGQVKMALVEHGLRRRSEGDPRAAELCRMIDKLHESFG